MKMKSRNGLYIVCIALLGFFIVYSLYYGLKIRGYISNGNALARSTTVYSRQTDSQTSILVLGDSLAYGVGASTPEQSFAGQLASRFKDAQVINNARVGEDIESLAQSIDSLIDKRYSKIFVIVGGNDIAHYGINIEQSKVYLAKIYAVLAKNSDQAYTYTTINFTQVSAVPPVLKGFYSQRSNEMRQESQRLASMYENVTYVDTFVVEPKLYSTLEASDGFHLNDAGIKTLLQLTFPD